MATLKDSVRTTLLATTEPTSGSEVPFGIIEQYSDEQEQTGYFDLIAELTTQIITKWEVVLYRAVDGSAEEKLANTLLHPSASYPDNVPTQIVLETATAVMEVAGRFFAINQRRPKTELGKTDREAIVNLITYFGPDFGQEWMSGRAVKQWLETEYSLAELYERHETASPDKKRALEEEIEWARTEIEKWVGVFNIGVRKYFLVGNKRFGMGRLREFKERHELLSDETLAKELDWSAEQVQSFFVDYVKKRAARDKNPLATAVRWAQHFSTTLSDANIAKKFSWSLEEVQEFFTDGVKKNLSTHSADPTKALEQIQHNLEELLTDKRIAEHLGCTITEAQNSFPAELRREFAIFHRSNPLDAVLNYYKKMATMTDENLVLHFDWDVEKVQALFPESVKRRITIDNKDPLQAASAAVKTFEKLPSQLPASLRWDLAVRMPRQALSRAKYILECAADDQTYPDFGGQLSEAERLWLIHKSSDSTAYHQRALGRIIWYSINQYRSLENSNNPSIDNSSIKSGDELRFVDFDNIDSGNRAYLLRLAQWAEVSEEELLNVFDEIASGKGLSQNSLVLLARLRTATASRRLSTEQSYIDRRRAIRNLLFEDRTTPSLPTATSIARQIAKNQEKAKRNVLSNHLGTVGVFVHETLEAAQKLSISEDGTNGEVAFSIIDRYSDSPEPTEYLSLVSELTTRVISTWEAAIFDRNAAKRTDKLIGFLLSASSPHFNAATRRHIVLETASAVMEVAGWFLDSARNKSKKTLPPNDKKALVKLISKNGPDFGQEWLSGRTVDRWLEKEYRLSELKQHRDAAVGHEKRILEETVHQAERDAARWHRILTPSRRKGLINRRGFSKSPPRLLSRIKHNLDVTLADETIATSHGWDIEQVQSVFSLGRKTRIAFIYNNPLQHVASTVKIFQQLPAELDTQLRWAIALHMPKQAVTRAKQIVEHLDDEKNFPSFGEALSATMRQWCIYQSSCNPVKYRQRAMLSMKWQDLVNPHYYDAPSSVTGKSQADRIMDTAPSPETILFGEESALDAWELLVELAEEAGVSDDELDELIEETRRDRGLSLSSREALKRLQATALINRSD